LHYRIIPASRSNSRCVIGSVVCPSLPGVAHATSFYVSGSRQVEVANTGLPCADTTVTDGNSCHYECHDGYRLTGSPILVCSSSAQWDGTVPSCIGKFQFLFDNEAVVPISRHDRRFADVSSSADQSQI